MIENGEVIEKEMMILQCEAPDVQENEKCLDDMRVTGSERKDREQVTGGQVLARKGRVSCALRGLRLRFPHPFLRRPPSV